MMRRFLLLLATVPLALNAAACDQGSASTGGSPAQAAACEESAVRLCAAFERCTPPSFALLWDSSLACREDQARACARRRGWPGVLVTDAAWQKCVDDQLVDCRLLPAATTISVGPAGSFPYEAPSCRFRGALALGAACEDNAQCESGLCGYRDGCQRCVEGVPLGGQCAFPPTGTPGAGDFEGHWEACAQGLFCAGNCIPLRALGESCTEDPNVERCHAPLECVAGVCALRSLDDSTWGRCGERVCDNALGEVCRSQLDGGGLACEPQHLAGAGEACTLDGATACIAGLDCVEGTCVAARDACLSTSECAAGASCVQRRCARVGNAANVCPAVP